jgi:hypothetical protein
MLKNILNLKGALKLTKSEQKEINGGKTVVPPGLCDEASGGFITDISNCLCKNSTYNLATQSCEGGGQSLARVFDAATGCCTSF